MVDDVHHDGVRVPLFIPRFSHFEKKIRVYDMVLVELFKIHLDVDPSFLPSWMSLDQYNEVKALMQS